MEDYAHPDMLVATAWVNQHASDPGVRLIEVDVDTTAFEHGHIPGAIGLNWTTQLCDPVRRGVLSTRQFEALCRQHGIAQDTTVVFYGDHHNWFAAYALWQFRYQGHPESHLRLMNGGRIKWINEGRPLTKEVPSFDETEYEANQPDHTVRSHKEDVLHMLQNGPVNMVDVRSPREYDGSIAAPPGMTETAARRGHIPGAVNIPWSQTTDEDGAFKSYGDLKKLYESSGVALDQQTISYCRIGERSAHTWFALKYLLGVAHATNYDGSWIEWGNLDDVPIETGSGR